MDTWELLEMVTSRVLFVGYMQISLVAVPFGKSVLLSIAGCINGYICLMTTQLNGQNDRL